MSRHHFHARCADILLVAFLFGLHVSLSQENTTSRFAVIAYFHGDTTDLLRYPLETLTHLCYSFAHLKGNVLSLNGSRDTLNLRYLVSIKRTMPNLKILLSLGGWGGCESCSDVFSTEKGRSDFSRSAKDLVQSFKLDGIDIDWEYPSVEGFPGHRFTPDDRHHFTLLLRELRNTLGKNTEITFASGATTDCLSRSIEWGEAIAYVNRVHLMTYDFVNGYSTRTGHHTPLFATPQELQSTDTAVRFLDSAGVPPAKIVIGLAFYARVWKEVGDANNGLYQTGTFLRYVAYKDFEQYFSRENGFVCHWDSTAQAPYVYSASAKLFGTFDDHRSVSLKTSYAVARRLGGVMFWELKGDVFRGGLLDAISRVVSSSRER